MIEFGFQMKAQQTGTKAKLDTTFFLLSSSTVVSPHENGV
jgi:hypothetical protein